jgi:hypothetical protein
VTSRPIIFSLRGLLAFAARLLYLRSYAGRLRYQKTSITSQCPFVQHAGGARAHVVIVAGSTPTASHRSRTALSSPAGAESNRPKAAGNDLVYTTPTRRCR